MLYSSRLEQAIRWAARAHATQTRKLTDIPYLTHPLSVCLILARGGIDDEATLIAAALHDVVEDSEVTLVEIDAAFGATVSGYVSLSSEIKRDADGRKRPWPERKQEHLQRLRTAPTAVKVIMLADKLHNLGTMLDDSAVSPDLWSRFNASPPDLLRYYADVIELADHTPELQLFVAEGRQLIAQLRAQLPTKES